METVNFAFMKFFNSLVKITNFWAFLHFWGDLRHALQPQSNTWLGQNAWNKSPQKRRNALKMVILTEKSKIFIKAKLTVSKRCLLGPTYFMIFCILGDVHLQRLSFLRGLSTELIFFNFSDIVTYPRGLWNQN